MFILCLCLLWIIRFNLLFKEVYNYIYQNVYTTIEFIFIRENYTYYNAVFKNKNILYIIYEIYFY